MENKELGVAELLNKYILDDAEVEALAETGLEPVDTLDIYENIMVEGVEAYEDYSHI